MAAAESSCRGQIVHTERWVAVAQVRRAEEPRKSRDLTQRDVTWTCGRERQIQGEVQLRWAQGTHRRRLQAQAKVFGRIMRRLPVLACCYEKLDGQHTQVRARA